MSDEFLNSLPEKESKALTLCGITTAKQLARISPQALLNEIEQARAYFPDDIPAELLDEERLQDICEGAIHHALTFPETAAEESTRLASERISQQVKLFGIAKEEDNDDFYVGHAPVNSGFLTDIKQEINPVSNLDPAEAERGKSMRFSTIRCGHPITIYVACIATLMLLPAFILCIAMLVLAMGNTITPTQLGICLGVMLLLLIFYFLMNYFARCTVCHIHVFSLRAYPRNKYAFRLPLLGYTFSTALHILFTLKFTCPACGTKLKLAGHNPHHHHRHRHQRENELYGTRRHHNIR